MLQTKEKISIVLNYLDPHWMLRYESELKTLLADPRVICINVPLQSASQTVLDRMKRDYDPQRVFKMLAEVKSKNPGLAVKTNVLVGFPGETWRDYFKSQFALSSFDAIVAMKYSPRPHTLAIKYPDQISDRIKSSRLLMMNLMILFRHFTVATVAMLRPNR
jgi:threonylcarbamoyladenosine tRNA methylthiotransferase MtaB